jgi:hypothetical protein
MNIGRGLFNMFRIGLTALWCIVVLKLITAKYDLGPTSDIVAIA